ncbi:hypothetical protein [Salinimicrobium soli]|uniref:hypothetical protein n=1 Tax=Salinimicrobium soli TaxID=1254399 RepID=UPI003AB0683F
MLLNISEGFSAKKELIDTTVGKPFNLEERQKLKNTSLSGLLITAASIDIYNLLVLNEGISYCTVELRSNGVIISFRAKTDSFALLIPFYKMKIYKGKAEEYSFYKDNYFIKIQAKAKEPEIHQFIRKIKDLKIDNSNPRIEDL